MGESGGGKMEIYIILLANVTLINLIKKKNIKDINKQTLLIFKKEERRCNSKNYKGTAGGSCFVMMGQLGCRLWYWRLHKSAYTKKSQNCTERHKNG